MIAVRMFKLVTAIAVGVVFVALGTVAAAKPQCAPVSLVLGGSKPFTTKFGVKSAAFAQTSANFAKAYAKACAEGLLKRRPLIPVNGANAGKLFLVNAQEANVASIYPGDGLMLLEYWFVDHKGKASAPAVNELHEAIYCAVHGASAKEQEESGRCLPD